MTTPPVDHSSLPSAPKGPRLDWTQLLTPVSSTCPSGPNLEYSGEFAELERLAQGTPDRQMGSALVPGQAPDPAAVLQRGVRLLQHTKDVRVLTWLLGACVPVLGIESFVSGLSALRELLERFWDSVHPELDPDDEARATARANAILGCASPDLLRALRRAPLLDSREGWLCLEDALQAQRDAAESDTAAGAARLLSALHEQSPDERAKRIGSLQRGLTETHAITQLFSTRCAAVPDLQPLQAFFSAALAVLRQRRTADEPAADEPAQLGALLTPPAAGVDSVAPGVARRNPILSRDDVLQALEQICAYYQAREPASPLPLLLRRCQRLVGLDFLGTLRELAPEALAQVALISGASAEPSRSQ